MDEDVYSKAPAMDSCFGIKAGAGLCHYMPDATEVAKAL